MLISWFVFFFFLPLTFKSRHAKSCQLCLTFCDSMDHSPPGSSAQMILQESILKLVAMPFSRGSSWSRDQTYVSYFKNSCSLLNYSGTCVTNQVMSYIASVYWLVKIILNWTNLLSLVQHLYHLNYWNFIMYFVIQ